MLWYNFYIINNLYRLVNSFMILAPSNAIPNIQRVNSPINPNQVQGQPTQQFQVTQPTQLSQQIQWAGQNIQVLSGSGSSGGIQVVDLRDAQGAPSAKQPRFQLGKQTIGKFYANHTVFEFRTHFQQTKEPHIKSSMLERMIMSNSNT